MTSPDELERAVERLSEMLPRLDACSGYAAHSGTPAARQTGAPRDLYWNDHLASDLRLILSANREMRAALVPFAKAAALFDAGDYINHDACIYRPAAGDEYSLSSGHLLAARSALTTQRGDGE